MTQHAPCHPERIGAFACKHANRPEGSFAALRMTMEPSNARLLNGNGKDPEPDFFPADSRLFSERLCVAEFELDEVHPVGGTRGDDLVAEIIERRVHVLAAAFARAAVADHDVGAGLL